MWSITKPLGILDVAQHGKKNSTSIYSSDNNSLLKSIVRISILSDNLANRMALSIWYNLHSMKK